MTGASKPLPSPRSTAIDKTIEQQQLTWELIAELRRKFQIHPRAVRQLQAVLLRLSFSYSSEEISEALGVDNTNAVAVLVAHHAGPVEPGVPGCLSIARGKGSCHFLVTLAALQGGVAA